MIPRPSLDDDPMLFSEEAEAAPPREVSREGAWPVLIVDDDPGIAAIARVILRDLTFLGRSVELIAAGSAAEAKSVLAARPDIAVVLLDVVMESEDAGLVLAREIRGELGNADVRIVLLTGQPGQAPEREVVLGFDINDYKSKVELTAQKLFTTVVSALRTFAEITERRRAADELKAALARAEIADRAKMEFLANVSHELRTPLTAILGFSEFMLDEISGPVSPPKYREYLNDIYTSGQHLMTLLNDILDMSKIEAGKTAIEDSELDVQTVIDECIRMLEPLALKKRLLLSAAVPPGLPRLRADARMVSQMLINLISNSIKFTPPGSGGVEVAAEAGPNGGLSLVVVDTGIGIHAKDISRVVEPFNTVDEALSGDYQGIGLGLTIASRMIGLHGGDLLLESVPGTGTKASLRFPPERTVTAAPGGHPHHDSK